MGRSNKTLRIDDEVDSWVDKFAEENNVARSDVVNRAVKVYAAKLAKGEWKDPKFKDQVDKTMDELA